MNLFSIFLLGIAILVGALGLNGIARLLSLPNWYSFLANPKTTSLIGYIWLFLVYPLGLGLIAFFASKWFL